MIEDHDGSRVDGAMERPSARVLLVEPGGRLLLFRSTTAAGTWLWFPPGGGLEPGESFEEAARRELWEETGRQDALGPCVWTRDSTWYWAHVDRMVRSLERFYLVRVDAPFDPRPQHIGEYEEYIGLDGWNHWWSVDEITASHGFETFVPRRLHELIPPLLAGEVPATPFEVGP
ncbi:MAG: NUDIX domain-containing protein [Chloroflexi bacterium]|nr:NUDIX domain-containing protein [Chloroflexota bacterium]MDA1241153.1 NUDIX domain-containing protein [Chloroflexota bacterium]